MKKAPLTGPEQISSNMSEARARDFWDSHEVTEEYLSKAELESSNLPPTRTPTASQSINLRIETDTLSRLKSLAARKRMGYQTLLKTFLAERLYEEEKREGLR